MRTTIEHATVSLRKQNKGNRIVRGRLKPYQILLSCPNEITKPYLIVVGQPKSANSDPFMENVGCYCWDLQFDSYEEARAEVNKLNHDSIYWSFEVYDNSRKRWMV